MHHQRKSTINQGSKSSKQILHQINIQAKHPSSHQQDSIIILQWQRSIDKLLQELGHHEQGLQHAAKLLQDNQNRHQEQILQVAKS